VVLIIHRRLRRQKKAGRCVFEAAIAAKTSWDERIYDMALVRPFSQGKFEPVRLAFASHPVGVNRTCKGWQMLAG